MALTVYQGYQGSVKFHASGGAVATIAGVTAWSIGISKEIISTTNISDTYEKRVGGLVSGSGSIELLYTAESASIIAAVNTTEDPGTALFELYRDTDGGKKISFAGIIDSADYGSSTDDIQRVVCTFVTNGTITTTV